MDVTLEAIAAEIAKQLEGVEGRLVGHVSDEVSRRLEGRFRESEERVKEHIDKLESRIEGRLAIHFEGVKDQVQRGAEGYGATLESIDRRLDRLEKDSNRNFRLHSSVLKNHADRIGAIEKLR